MDVCEGKFGTGECNQYTGEPSVLCVGKREVLGVAVGGHAMGESQVT